MTGPRIFRLSMASLYPLYVAKAERKGRTKAEVDEIITWLTGYDEAALAGVLAEGSDVETFFTAAPAWHAHATKITGVICGHRVEEITDPVMWRIRCLDKLVDELARGKKLATILRA